jgi:hypothetical protein
MIGKAGQKRTKNYKTNIIEQTESNIMLDVKMALSVRSKACS